MTAPGILRSQAVSKVARDSTLHALAKRDVILIVLSSYGLRETCDSDSSPASCHISLKKVIRHVSTKCLLYSRNSCAPPS